MREIKFRAWDTRQNWQGTEIPTMRNQQYIYDMFVQEGTFEEEGMVFMQFTGLYDKNGTEIYEGDVVRYENAGYDPSEGETPWEIGTVIFKNLAWMVDSDDYMLCEFTLTDLEVVGNIYENPDLIKK